MPRVNCMYIAVLMGSLVGMWAHEGAWPQQTSKKGGAWKTGEAFTDALTSPAGVTWSANPLAAGLHNLGRAQGLAIFLDRRIDPTQEVDFAVDGVSLEQLLRQLAERTDAGVCFVGPVIYFGPQEVTELLPTIAALRRDETDNPKFASTHRKQLMTAKPWQWDELTSPQSLLHDLEGQYAVKISNPEQMLHDLWAAGSLPPLGFADRLTILLAGFGLTFEYDAHGKSVTLVPLPTTATRQHTYEYRGDASAAVSRLSSQFPQAKMSRRGKGIFVDGTWEVHEAIRRTLQGSNGKQVKRPTAAAEKRFTLRVVNQPVGGVIKGLASQWMLNVQLDANVEQAMLTQLISFDQADLTQEEILTAILKPAGLTFRIEGDRLEIAAARP